MAMLVMRLSVDHNLRDHEIFAPLESQGGQRRTLRAVPTVLPDAQMVGRAEPAIGRAFARSLVLPILQITST
jgi:hypothetical protein